MSHRHTAAFVRTFFLSLSALVATPLALAQTQAPPSVDVVYAHDTGEVANTGTATEIVATFVVQVPGAEWVQLQFDELRLTGDPFEGTSSFLRITSIEDGLVQRLDVIGARQWRDRSAYFNGDGVLVELFAEPGTGPNRVRVRGATAGLVPVPEESQCFATDDRVASTDPRAARILPVGCTGWLIDDCNHCMLTAGHCASGTTTIQFNVPLSGANGSIQHPPPASQYAVDQSSKQTNGGLGTGDDWAYFGCFANSTTGLEAFAAQGAAYSLALPPAFNPGQSIRITGYGVDSGSANQTQQTHVGPWMTLSGSLVQYQTDTEGGNSGSPVIHEQSGLAIGIHTHGGCSTGGGQNTGTASIHPGLQAALANPQGICGSPLNPSGTLPLVIVPGQATDVDVEYTGAIVPGTAFLHHRYDGGAFVTTRLASLGAGLYRGTLPAPSCGDTPEFYFSVDSPACGTLTSPAGAPANAYGALVGIETLLFTDDFEADLGWTVTNGAGVSTGTWERAVPLAGGTQEDPPSDADGTGNCYVTQNANGNFDVDGGTTFLVSPAIDLSGGALVSYEYWLGSTGAIGAGDGVTVEVATNAAGTNWQLVRSYTTPATTWRSDTITVGVEVAASSTVRLRFACSDVGTGHIVEGGVDALRASRVACDATGTAFCFGDGSGTACPCANAGSAGHGCENSHGTGGGVLSASGSASVAGDTVVLHTGALPTITTAIVFQGDLAENGGAGVPLADGLRCAGGTLIRLGTRLVTSGEIAFGFGVGADPLVSVQGSIPGGGATRYYQTYYRDPAAHCMPGTFNLTNGVEIVWAP